MNISHFGFLVGIFLAPIASSASALPVESPLYARSSNCLSNCATLVRIGKSSVVVAKDAAGEIFKVIPVEVPANARLRESTEHSTIHLMSGDGHVETHTESFETKTEIVVVTYHFYYDGGGNLVDVRLSVTRFLKQMEK